MAYLVLTADHQELLRFELTETTVIGRSPECAICVRDVSLSRWHCRVEKSLAGWVIADLNSKNGTFMNGEKISRRRLHDLDELKLGRTTITFHAGAIVPAPPGTPIKRRRSHRPVDPSESLSSTVEGFVFDETDALKTTRRVYPRPRPPEPAAYKRDDLYSMLTEIASSSWDSIYATASRPIHWERPQPTPMVKTIQQQALARRRSPGVSIMLQVHETKLQTAPVGSTRRFLAAAKVRVTRIALWMTKVGLTRLF